MTIDVLRWVNFALGPGRHLLGADSPAGENGRAQAAFAVWARAMLDANWSGIVAIKAGHELIRSGPYRWVRHPIYSGLLLAVLGTALAEVRGLLAFLAALLGWGIKAVMEERFLIDQFDADYVRYSRKVKRLIPFIF